MIRKLAQAAIVAAAGLALVGCDQKGNEAKHIKVGVINGAEQDVAEVVIAVERGVGKLAEGKSGGQRGPDKSAYEHGSPVQRSLTRPRHPCCGAA